jgi:hypothetical protein
MTPSQNSEIHHCVSVSRHREDSALGHTDLWLEGRCDSRDRLCLGYLFARHRRTSSRGYLEDIFSKISSRKIVDNSESGSASAA